MFKPIILLLQQQIYALYIMIYCLFIKKFTRFVFTIFIF
jgi:hypothetical protein